MKLSVVIPVFNESKTIEKILEKVAEVKITNTPIEIIVVDDGSTDTTVAKIKKIKNKIKSLKFIEHNKNRKGIKTKKKICNNIVFLFLNILFHESILDQSPKSCCPITNCI